jgi:peptidoglycan/LPS O-acetylase OafA/YrhL
MPAESQKTTTEPKRLHSIDALRGLAFLGVFLVHAGQAIPSFAGKSLTVAGGYGVSLFFIASAFTLYASHQHRQTTDGQPVVGFFLRRIFRIVPLFWAGIIFYYLLYGTWNRGWAEGSLGIFHFGLTAGLLHGWHPETINSVVPGGWSIAAEFGFYLLAPLLFLLITSWRRAVVACVVATLLALELNAAARGGAVAKLFPLVPDWRLGSFTYLWLPAHLPTFLLGFLVFHLRAPYLALPVGLRRGFLAATVVTLVLLAWQLRGDAADYVFPLALAAFVLALLADPVAWLVNTATCALGVLSFSAYITHFAALKAVEKILARLAVPSPELSFLFLCVGALLLTVAASWVTHRFIEQPGIALGRQIARALRPSGASINAHAA